ncbi:hypothetical protein [Humibacter sp.]|jgi:hypothetical protein|uniref:hypothetical protein n=1 Tax=Humibacter sp. TaxID=1940291 RepID=UPI002C983BB7|nr:hypothetical protein [Humibacter sp.]HVX07437.1 hypothetical protein [Humibacter sp.]
MTRGNRRPVVAAAVLAAAGAVAVVGAVLLPPAGALGMPSADAGAALVLSGDADGTVHEVRPDMPALWNVGVTVHRMPVRTLVGVVTSQGGFFSHGTAVKAQLEVRGCSSPWLGAECANGERVILPSTAAEMLPGTPAALTDPARPVPARTWVQARVAVTSDAPIDTSGELRVRLTVNAAGDDAASGTEALADTGSVPLAAALLALAAVSAGFAAAALARGWRRG